MDITRLTLKKTMSSSGSSTSSINQKSHHNISKEQPHRTFSLMTQNHQQHLSSATTSTNTNSVITTSTTTIMNSSGKQKKNKPAKFGKSSYLDDNDDWIANVGEYTIENEDKFFISPSVSKAESEFLSNKQSFELETDARQGDNGNEIRDQDNSDEDSALTLKQKTENRILAQYETILYGSKNIKLNELRDISWQGIPLQYKSVAWKLLLGYLPPNVKRHELILKQKRQSYKNGIEQSIKMNKRSDNTIENMEIMQLNENNKQTWHQIDIDLKRTHPDIPLYQFSSVKRSLQRILYYWAIRRPTTGYVQGINDICTTFYQVFLLDYYKKGHKDKKLDWDDIEKTDPEEYMSQEDFNSLESDAFWCFDRFLESIMDNYVHGQPGILRQVSKLEQLCKRIDPALHAHFVNEQVEFFQFAFRWMNCLLMREIPMRGVLRMWDTYLAESSSDITSNDGEELDFVINNEGDSDKPLSPSMALRNNSILRSDYTSKNNQSSIITSKKSSNTKLNDFHVYVCWAFLEKWATTLENMDFTGIIMFLQSCPTTSWKNLNIEILLSEAYLWQCHFKDS
ncbi:hypothetical protein QEN19_002251 [Hanseniaspora menglaensis]